MSDEHNKEDEQKESKPSTITIIGSIISGAFGVQSSRNRERDFKHGRLRNYIITALIFVGLFIGGVVTIVQLVLKQAS